MAIPERTPEELLRRMADAAAPVERDAMVRTLIGELSKSFRPPTGHPPLFGSGPPPPSAASTAAALETISLDRLGRAPNVDAAELAWKGPLRTAYRIRRSILHPDHGDLVALARWAVDGVLARRQAELRLALRQAPLTEEAEPTATPWDEFVLRETCRAFLLNVRRQEADLAQAIQVITRLREAQAHHEARLLGPVESGDERLHDQTLLALRLVGRYHLARAVELSAEFCAGCFEGKSGRERLSARGIQDEIDRHVFTAREALSGLDPEVRLLAARLGLACNHLVDSSVYAALVPRRARALLLGTQADGRKPVLELWHSQREALRQNLLDPTKAAVVLSMPTSAGKTLLAELAISNIDPAEGRIVYLAPTRALVTQVALTLKRHLAPLKMRVTVATPSFELNPVEEQILAESFDVLVTTPEKLDLLVRTDHVAVRELALVIVDEAHGLNDNERGSRLELLLATLRRERSRIRFLLLTPFAGNADTLARWLGGSSAGLPIVLDWRPNERAIGVVWAGNKERKGPRPLHFETMASAHSDYPESIQFDLGAVPGDTTSAEKTTVQAAIKWASARAGGVLVLAQSRQKAQDRAEAIARGREERACPVLDLIARYLEDEVRGPHPLSPLLRKEVAFHHAGLSAEARYLVERLVEVGRVRVLCATTTLAQGVHFPLSAALIESIQRQTKTDGNWVWTDLAPWEFWNIVGRVGRALEDPLGTIAFALPQARAAREAKRQKIAQYLQDDAAQVTSSLIEVLEALARGENIEFSTRDLRAHRSLSGFLQYVLHAVAVSGLDRVHLELEGLLRGSLVFEQARTRDPDLADALIRFGRTYLGKLGSKGPWYFRMADGTGFSSPSVDLVYARAKELGLTQLSPEKWSAAALFPRANQPSQLLVDIIDTLRLVPEVKLGTEDVGQFSADRVARITAAWVNGAALADLAASEYDGDLLKCCAHVYGAITSAIPWGLRAMNRIVRRRQQEEEDPEADLASAMVFHGVRSAEAIALRMNGVPRLTAEGLAVQLRRDLGSDLSQTRRWLEDRGDADWQGALPQETRTTGAEMRRIWEVLEGRRELGSLLER
jgi:hypothetical protein